MPRAGFQGAQVLGQRREQSHAAVVALDDVVLADLAERDRTLDADVPRSDVSPDQRQRLFGTQAGVCQESDEHRVLLRHGHCADALRACLPAGAADRLDGRRPDGQAAPPWR
jgi:hypothetical protein